MTERWCECKGHRSRNFTKLTDYYCRYFIPTGWKLEYTTLIEPEETRTLYITGKCSQCGGFMRSGVGIYGKFTHDKLLEDICRAMLNHRPYAGKDEFGFYLGAVPQRLEWYWHQDQMTKTERIKQFVSLFREPDWQIVRRWAEIHMRGHEKLTEYTVTIEEHIAQDFSVKAFDLYQAMQIAEKQYRQGLLVVQPSVPNTRLLMARDNKTGKMTEWKEF